MNVCLVSAFRDSSGYIDQYFAQVDSLYKALTKRADRLRLVVGEGDSVDCTRELLEQHLSKAEYLNTLLEVAHGGPSFGSVIAAKRFKQLSQVWSKIWGAIPQGYSAVLFVESDLIWEADTLLTLLDCLDTYPMIAPKILCPRLASDWFWDVWGFRKDGWQFGPKPPYFSDLHEDPTDPKPVQLDSVGSCFAIRGALAHKLTWPEEDVVVGLCRQVYELGEAVWMHPELSVNHP